MAITQVIAQFNNQWYVATFDSTTNRYKVKFTPSATSYNQPGRYYSTTVEATNSDNVVVTVSGATKPALRLTVREEISPTITMQSLLTTYCTDNTPTIVFDVQDEENGSGVNLSTLYIKIGGTTVTSGYTTTNITRGYRVTYNWPTAIADGTRVVEIGCSDFDANPVVLQHTFVVDTTPPELFCEFFPNHTVVDEKKFSFKGSATDLIANPVTLQLFINNVKWREITLPATGEFDEEVDFIGSDDYEMSGAINVQVKAVDAAGLFVTKDWYYIRLITNRNEEDTANLAQLYAKALIGELTTDEWNEWLKSRARGAYNYTDINRVNLAAEYLIDLFYTFGYDIVFTPQLTPSNSEIWGDQDEYLDTHTVTYLNNIQIIYNLISLPATTPQVPNSIVYDMSRDDANNIEKIMVIVDSLVPGLISQFVYSDEFFCGEV